MLGYKHIRVIVCLMGASWVGYANHGSLDKLENSSFVDKTYSNRDAEQDWETILADAFGKSDEELRKDLGLQNLSQATKDALKKLAQHLKMYGNGSEKKWLDKVAADHKLTPEEIEKVKEALQGVKDDEQLNEYWKKVSPIFEAYNETSSKSALGAQAKTAPETQPAQSSSAQSSSAPSLSASAADTLGQLSATLNTGTDSSSSGSFGGVNRAQTTENSFRSTPMPNSQNSAFLNSIASQPLEHEASNFSNRNTALTNFSQVSTAEVTPSKPLPVLPTPISQPIETKTVDPTSLSNVAKNSSSPIYTYAAINEPKVEAAKGPTLNTAPSYSKMESYDPTPKPSAIRSLSSIDNAAIYKSTTDSSYKLLDAALSPSNAVNENPSYTNKNTENYTALETNKESFAPAIDENYKPSTKVFEITETNEATKSLSPSLSGLKKPNEEPPKVDLGDLNALAYNPPPTAQPDSDKLNTGNTLLTQLKKKNTKPASYFLYHSKAEKEVPQQNSPPNKSTTDLFSMLKGSL